MRISHVQTVFYEGHTYELLAEPVGRRGPLPWPGLDELAAKYDFAWSRFATPQYIVQNERFCLKDIHLEGGETEDEFAQLPIINGISPKFYEKQLEDGTIIKSTSQIYYEDVALLMQITGYITIGRNPISGYEPLGSIWRLRTFEVVLRLEVIRGKLVDVRDFSQEVKLIRETELEIQQERETIKHGDKRRNYEEHRQEELENFARIEERITDIAYGLYL